MRTHSLVFLLLWVIGMLCIHTNSTAQRLELCYESTSKKAVKYYKDGVSARKSRKGYDAVKKNALRSIKEDSLFAAPHLLLGDVAYIYKDYKTMRQSYEKLIELCPDASAISYYRLGRYYYNVEEYKKCITTLSSFLDFNYEQESLNEEVEILLFRAKLMAKPVSYNPIRVKGLSTSDPEYLPFISPDNELCFFTRRYEEFPKGALTPRSVEKFMISKKDAAGNFGMGSPMLAPFNMSSSNNEGGPTITKDNRTLYFTFNYEGNFDIYYSEWTIDGWGPIQNMGPNVNDPKQWDSQPSISSDGKDLYFASYRDTIYFTSDIFRTTNTNGSWTKPEKLPFNTNGNEKTPFIHPDNRTLYFASDSLPGMGGYDIYLIRKDADGKWGEPVNIGYPINTGGDQVGFIISTDGSKGYFASNIIKNSRGYDIYSFDLPEKLRPERVLFVKGELRDSNNQIPLAVKVELKNIETQEMMEVDYDSTTGKYASVVLFDADYILTVKQEGHAYNSAYFSEIEDIINEPVTIDFDMKKMEVGAAYKLNNIFFETNSYELNAISKNILADFNKFLTANPTIKVSIHGHTDNVGGAASNLALSENRAKAVYRFLISHGLAKNRLSYKGFGQSKPVDTNSTSEGKAKNRRTEFVITNK
jgi:outer membrane protein OmpA-like peptidoglycan-associated protein/Tol biopolymer transport system component